jgi:general secretion pathway protein B
MSFILEALHKAEQERGGSAPQPMAPAQQASGPARQQRLRIYLASAVGGAIALALYLGITQLSTPAQEPAATAPDTAAITAVATPPPTREAVPAPAPQAEPAEPAEPALMAATIPASTNSSSGTRLHDLLPTASSKASMVDHSPAAPLEPDLEAPVPAEEAQLQAPGQQEENAPLMQNLPKSVRAQLPPLELNIHVYSTDPSRRFVYINSQRYGEGSEVADGVSLEKITPNGVVLIHQGTPFRLALEN